MVEKLNQKLQIYQSKISEFQTTIEIASTTFQFLQKDISKLASKISSMDGEKSELTKKIEKSGEILLNHLTENLRLKKEIQKTRNQGEKLKDLNTDLQNKIISKSQ